MDDSRVTWARPVKTALHQAVLDVRLHQVRLLVAKQYCNVNTKDVHGRTPLMLACTLENEEQGRKMLQIFLDDGALLDAKDNLGRTALSYACIKSKERIARVMLKEDALNLNDVDNDGNTAIHHAALCGNPSLVEVLCESVVRFGFNIDARNNLGYTPLMLACKSANFASAYTLMTVGKASVAIRDNEFFYNANDWIQRSYYLHPRASGRHLGLDKDRRARTAPPYTSLSRENTVYSSPSTHACNHTKSQLQKMIRYNTEIFAHKSYGYYSKADLGLHNRELRVGKRDSRALLVEAVAAASDKLPSQKKAEQRYRPVKSAKLRSVIRASAPLKSPDVKTIFKAYTSQYAYGLQMQTLESEQHRFTQNCDSPTNMADFSIEDFQLQLPIPVKRPSNITEPKLPQIGVM